MGGYPLLEAFFTELMTTLRSSPKQKIATKMSAKGMTLYKKF